MSEARLDVTGSGAVAERELQKVTKQLAKVREENRRLNEESKKGSAASAISMSNMTREAVGMAGRFFTVGTAVGAITRAYSDWRTKTDELIDAHDQLSNSFTRVLAEAGKLRLAPQAEQFVKGIKGATPEQATAALSGVMQSGETLSDKRTFAVASEIAKLAPTQIDLTQAGKLAADIADIGGEGITASDVADLTVGIKQQLREKTEQFSGPKFQRQMEHLKRGGMSGTDAIAHAVAALQSEQGATALDLLATKGTQRTSDQRKMIRDVFAPEKITTIKEQLAKYQREDIAAQQLTALEGSSLTAASLTRQQQEQATAQNVLTVDAYSEARKARRFIREKAYAQGAGTYAAAGIESAAAYLADPIRTPRPVQEVIRAERAGFVGREEGHEMIQALNKTTEALLRNTAATRDNTHSSGVRINTETHTEGNGGASGSW